MGGLSLLFKPKCHRPFMRVPDAGTAAGVVQWENPPASPDPVVDAFISDGRFNYRPGGMAPVDGAGIYGDSSREFFPDQIIGDPFAIARPSAEMPAWGTYLYGMYDAFADGVIIAPQPTFDPVQPGDYFDEPEGPDDSQMYFITGPDADNSTLGYGDGL